MEDFTTGTGQKLKVHDKEQCKGYNCCIHNPSDHHMVDWPLYWRFDRRFFERIDPEGVGHPDPDEIECHKKHRYDISIHGCNGLCHPVNYKKYIQEKEKNMENLKTGIDWIEDFEEFLKQENVWEEYVENTTEYFKNDSIYFILENEIEDERCFILEGFTWDGHDKLKWEILDDKWLDYIEYWKENW